MLDFLRTLSDVFGPFALAVTLFCIYIIVVDHLRGR